MSDKQLNTKSDGMTAQERELGAIIRAYSEVTDRLKSAHEQLAQEVARLSAELKKKNAELRRKDRLAALGEMAAGLAHEVRNPLGGIALYSSMLERELTDKPKALNAATRITQGVRSLDRLVGEILDFAQEDRLDLHRLKLGSVLNQIEESAMHWAHETGASLLINPTAYDVSIDADPQRLGQVLLNLVMNGMQAAGKGGRVQISATTKSDGSALIEVWDNGPGIPAEVRDRIFNPFFTTKDAGTGLGLAIVHRIVEAHAGTIRVTNDSRGGARFSICLPTGKDVGGLMMEAGSSTPAALRPTGS